MAVLVLTPFFRPLFLGTLSPDPSFLLPVPPLSWFPSPLPFPSTGPSHYSGVARDPDPRPSLLCPKTRGKTSPKKGATLGPRHDSWSAPSSSVPTWVSFRSPVAWKTHPLLAPVPNAVLTPMTRPRTSTSLPPIDTYTHTCTHTRLTPYRVRNPVPCLSLPEEIPDGRSPPSRPGVVRPSGAWSTTPHVLTLPVPGRGGVVPREGDVRPGVFLVSIFDSRGPPSSARPTRPLFSTTGAADTLRPRFPVFLFGPVSTKKSPLTLSVLPSVGPLFFPPSRYSFFSGRVGCPHRPGGVRGGPGRVRRGSHPGQKVSVSSVLWGWERGLEGRPVVTPVPSWAWGPRTETGSGSVPVEERWKRCSTGGRAKGAPTCHYYCGSQSVRTRLPGRRRRPRRRSPTYGSAGTSRRYSTRTLPQDEFHRPRSAAAPLPRALYPTRTGLRVEED